jgi:hypothetical protein
VLGKQDDLIAILLNGKPGTAMASFKQLSDVDAICVPGGFGIRGIEGKLGASFSSPPARVVRDARKAINQLQSGSKLVGDGAAAEVVAVGETAGDYDGVKADE